MGKREKKIETIKKYITMFECFRLKMLFQF